MKKLKLILNKMWHMGMCLNKKDSDVINEMETFECGNLLVRFFTNEMLKNESDEPAWFVCVIKENNEEIWYKTKNRKLLDEAMNCLA